MTARKLDERYKTTVVRYQTTGKRRLNPERRASRGGPRVTVTACRRHVVDHGQGDKGWVAGICRQSPGQGRSAERPGVFTQYWATQAQIAINHPGPVRCKFPVLACQSQDIQYRPQNSTPFQSKTSTSQSGKNCRQRIIHKWKLTHKSQLRIYRCTIPTKKLVNLIQHYFQTKLIQEI